VLMKKGPLAIANGPELFGVLHFRSPRAYLPLAAALATGAAATTGIQSVSHAVNACMSAAGIPSSSRVTLFVSGSWEIDPETVVENFLVMGQTPNKRMDMATCFLHVADLKRWLDSRCGIRRGLKVRLKLTDEHDRIHVSLSLQST